ncbi:hypothetical protein [Reichenbachiella ulvae]|uniref:Uncharacterized protein n=1 Tax=Reichenbachiella ulvae TaxID=2980104 RepID=A0ABT3CT92_9BACT|nr:hypothetical protein [Reichenbachiella ulvae]MCV9386935.1 hypothetical protein [Reichenbachiella ulvae]
MSSNLELRSTYFYTEGLGSSSVSSPSNIYGRSSAADSTIEEKPSEKNKFAVATHMSQAIHLGLGRELSTLTSNYSQQKLASKINTTLEALGKLSLEHAANEVVGFDLNEKRSFDESVNTKICIRSGSHKGHAIVHIPSFIPKNDIKVPAEATNFKIEARLVAVSDFVRKSEVFEMLAPKSDGKFGSFESQMLPILKTSTQPMTAHLRLLESGPISQNASTALILAVKFYKYADKKFESLEEEALISVRNIF